MEVTIPGGGGSRFWLPVVRQKPPSLQNPAPTRLLLDASFRLPFPTYKISHQGYTPVAVFGGGGSRTPVLTVHPSTSTGLDPADESRFPAAAGQS